MANSLVELRKQAEEAVRGMADGDLKVKAFETILAHLLSSGNGAEERQAGSEKNLALKSGRASDKAPASLTERLASLKEAGFFSAQRSIGEVRQELKKNGWHYPLTSLSGPLQVLVQKRELRRERMNDERGRMGWRYSNP